MADLIADRQARMARRNERGVRVAAGFIAALALPSTVIMWMAPWDADTVSLRFMMPGAAALFVAVAVTGQGSRETRIAFRAAVMLTAVGWALEQGVPLLQLPVMYSVLALCLAAVTAMALVALDGSARWAAAAASAAAALALPWYRDRLGAYTPPLPSYVETLEATWLPFFYLVAIGWFADVYRRRGM